MQQRIKITNEESNRVQNLFETYNSYITILQFFMNQESIPNQETFDKKWNEAVELNRKIDNLKREIEKKYKPAGNWERFEFDFDNHEVVFMKNGA